MAPPVSLLSMILIFSRLVLFLSAEGNNRTHHSCPPFDCGKLGKLEFPFTSTQRPECGLCLVDGCTESVQKIQLERGGKWYEVESVFQNGTFEIKHNVTLFKCNCSLNFSAEFTLEDTPRACHRRGHGFNTGTGKNEKLLVSVAVAATLAAVIGVVMVTICCFRGKVLFKKIVAFWKNETRMDQSVETLFRNHGPLAITRYSYSDIKRMTNSFRNKLGQGGYGDVYRGKLQDGHLVAVKVLKESNGSGEEFINEVVSISRTSHVNIVTLMGFCFEGSKRALIYEFMPNGSLEKFIYKEDPSKTDCQLGWRTLYQIAVSIARGLDYLHKGCRTRILHLDIKPHNILLDQDFCPKISDFGLAKICPRKEVSIISLLGTRGTAGYIAPEVYSRNFGGVSHKSDVYSYGMMLLEMVGGRKNFNAGADHTSEEYFPDWIHEHVELDEELGLQGLTNEEDKESVRKMIIVSLWCIQTDPLKRPPMSRVLEMLEGRLESLQIPPKPFLYSPPRPLGDSFTTITIEQTSTSSSKASR